MVTDEVHILRTRRFLKFDPLAPTAEPCLDEQVATRLTIANDNVLASLFGGLFLSIECLLDGTRADNYKNMMDSSGFQRQCFEQWSLQLALAPPNKASCTCCPHVY